MARKLVDSWINNFLEYTKTLPSPERLRRWAAISCVAGALERKVWVRTFEDTYANMYVALIAPPSVGKTVPVGIVEEFWHKLEGHFLARSNLTKASLIDTLESANKKVVRPMEDPPVISFNSVKLPVKEMGTLIPAYDKDMMAFLTDVWDNKMIGDRKRGTGKDIVIERPQMNILTAATPAYLMELLPEGAWEEGFISRVMLIYSGEYVRHKFFQKELMNNSLRDRLIEDLKLIGDLFGEMKIESQVDDVFEVNFQQNFPPIPEHPKLLSYIGRRPIHILKTAMAISASRSDELVMRLQDFQLAQSLVLEAEQHMPDIFKASAGMGKVMADIHHFVMQLQVRNKNNPVREALVLEFVAGRVPTHEVERMVDIMVKAGLLEKIGSVIGNTYKAKARAKPL